MSINTFLAIGCASVCLFAARTSVDVHAGEEVAWTTSAHQGEPEAVVALGMVRDIMQSIIDEWECGEAIAVPLWEVSALQAEERPIDGAPHVLIDGFRVDTSKLGVVLLVKIESASSQCYVAWAGSDIALGIGNGVHATSPAAEDNRHELEIVLSRLSKREDVSPEIVAHCRVIFENQIEDLRRLSPRSYFLEAAACNASSLRNAESLSEVARASLLLMTKANLVGPWVAEWRERQNVRIVWINYGEHCLGIYPVMYSRQADGSQVCVYQYFVFSQAGTTIAGGQFKSGAVGRWLDAEVGLRHVLQVFVGN